MRFDLKEPCRVCPFRRAAVPGWTGAATPEEFIDATLDDATMPCHQTVNYEENWWQAEMLHPDSTVQHCAGARIFYRNQCKRSREPIVATADAVSRPQPSAAVFKTRAEFLEHHRLPTPAERRQFSREELLQKFPALRVWQESKGAVAQKDADDDGEEHEVTCRKCGEIFGTSFEDCPHCGESRL